LCAQEKEKEVDFCWDLYFLEFDLSDMKPEYKSQYEELVEFMNEFPDLDFVVKGNTYGTASEAYNLKLSEKKASSHRDYINRVYIISRGGDPIRIAAIGCGDHFPVIANAKEEYEQEQNRRTEIRILNEKEIPLVFFLDDRIHIYKNGSEVAGIKVDVNPQFPGGTKAFADLIKKNGYVVPKEHLGRIKLIYLDCVVDENGHFSVVDKADSYNIERERGCMKYLKNMPSWIPAKCQGMAVPVNFRICLQL